MLFHQQTKAMEVPVYMGLFHWLYKLIFRKNSKHNRTGNVRASNMTKASETIKYPKANPQASSESVSDNPSLRDAEYSETKSAAAADLTDAHQVAETVLTADEPELSACAETQAAGAAGKSDEEDSPDQPAPGEACTDTADGAESDESTAAQEEAAAPAAEMDDGEYSANGADAQTADEADDFAEEKEAEVPCSFDKTADRLRSLRSSCCANWPLRRLLAFGAVQEEITRLIDGDNDTFSVFDQYTDQGAIPDAEKYAWLERLEDQAWESAFEMCGAWQELLQKHSAASSIEHFRTSGISESVILAKTKVSSAEAQQLCRGFREAVLQWLNAWHAQLGFLYDHCILQTGKAEFFFGKLTFAIVRSVAQEAPNYHCAWLAYKEFPLVLWNQGMKISKYSVAALAEETFRQLKTAENYDELKAWFENELHKKNIPFPAKALLNALLETKGVSPNDAVFKKSVSFHNVIKGDYTREADSTHASMAGEWNSLAKWLVHQFNIQPMLGAIEL